MRHRTALIVLLGLIFGISGAAYFSSVEEKTSWIPAPIGKHLALLKVEIAQPENIPDGGNDEVQLVGRILTNQNIEGDLGYKWILPEDVEVLEGETSDTLAGVKMGQIVELKLTVTGFTREKQKSISLQAMVSQGSQVLGNSAVVVSRPEDTWEAVAPEMKQAAEEQLGAGSKSRRGQ